MSTPEMTMKRVGVIGYGAIARTLLDILVKQGCVPADQVSILVRPGREAAAQASAMDILSGNTRSIVCYSSIDEFLSSVPDCVVECAGHTAVAAYVEPCLATGKDVIVASVGALADEKLFARLRSVAGSSGAQLTLPSGAIGGIDALAGARLAGIDSVVYTGKKPAKAWSGTAAETVLDLQNLDLQNLQQATVFFEGSAREAALAYPKNANVAATLALAGVGMDRTVVRLVADPFAVANIHEYSVKSSSVDYTVSLCGKASPENPKTSLSTAYSLARAVVNRSSAIVV